MARPRSIIGFQRLYLGGFACGLLATAISWNGNVERLAADPRSASIAGWYLPASTALSVAIVVTLWFLVARRGSRIAKWVLVVWTALGVLFALPGVLVLVTGRSPNAAAAALSILATALQVAAATMLFRSDAAPWFGEAPEPPREPLP